MKKLFLALAMTMMVGSVATVFAATDKTFEMGVESGTTEVKYSVDGSYTITIPETINLISHTEAAEATISASNVYIPYCTKLVVSVSSTSYYGNAWHIADTAANNSSNTIAYSIKNSESVDIKNNDAILEVNMGETEGASTTLNFKLNEKVTKAGEYSGTLTFTAGIVDTERPA